jgi:serine/threonine-protein phosphatase 2A regulatory subunit A
MIRRAVAVGLGKLCVKMKSDSFVQDMMPILKNLSADDQDSVRVLCIDSIVEISKVFSKELNKANIITLLILMVRDRAWKVRIKMSNSFAKLAEAMGTELTDNSLMGIFCSLLNDPEGEVRTAATQNFTGFLKHTPKVKYPVMIPYIQELTRDTIPLVRVCAYEILTLIAIDLPKEDVKHKLIGAVLNQFKTETDSEVKIELLKALTSCGIRLGAELFAIVTNQDIQSLMKERSWRVRKEVFNMIVEVSINAKSNQLFEVHFQEFFLSYLVDPVYQIRIHGNNLLPRILEIEPISWVANVLIPRIQKLRATDPSYLKRVTSLYAYEKLVKINPRDLQHACVSEVVFELKDKIPNIKLVALKVLKSIFEAADEQHRQTIKASAAPLVSDQDADVKSLAQSIIQA